MTDTPTDTTTPETAAAKSGSGFPHFPALDGVRGISVAVVWCSTGLLDRLWRIPWRLHVFHAVRVPYHLVALSREGWFRTIALGAFWKRRFKRLLPAAIACIGLIAFFWSVLDLQTESEISAVDVAGRIPGDLWTGCSTSTTGVRRSRPRVRATTHCSARPSRRHPQPLLVAVDRRTVLRVLPVAGSDHPRLPQPGEEGLRRRAHGAAAASVASPFLLDGFDRIYNGTDVRAAEILVGALLAVAFSTDRGREVITSSPAVPSPARWRFSVRHSVVRHDLARRGCSKAGCLRTACSRCSSSWRQPKHRARLP